MFKSYEIQRIMRKKQIILIVDDDSEMREVTRLFLKDKYTVVTSAGMEEALKYMADNSVNLVLLDINMLGINGLTALDDIKKRLPESIVVVMTAFASVETVRWALRLGAFGFLMKPFDIEELTNIVNKALQEGKKNKS